MNEIIEHLNTVLEFITLILIFLGILKIHSSIRTKFSFMMELSAIGVFVLSVIYLTASVIIGFYDSVDISEKTASFFLESVDYVFTPFHLLGAVGFLGFSKSFKKKIIEEKDNNSKI